MSHYVHHIPGRLRIRCSAIRRSPERAAAIRGLLERQPGVRAVVPSTVTGSIVIEYNTAATSQDALIGLLRDRGCLNAAPVPVRTPSRGTRTIPESQLASAIARKVATSLVEAAVERSLLAIVAAVI